MKKGILILCVGAVCLTGCSFFEKADDGDLKSLMDGFSNKNSTEEIVTDSAEVATDTSIDTTIDESMVTDETMDEVFEDTSEIQEENDVLRTYTVGETSEISFRSETMSTPVIVGITVDSMFRGDAAQDVVNIYNRDNEDSQIQEPTNPDLEFCVINYTLDLQATEGIPESSTEVKCAIKGADFMDSLVYEGKTYSNFPVMYNSTGQTITSGMSGNGQVIFMLPKGCANFNISFGDPEIASAIYTFN